MVSQLDHNALFLTNSFTGAEKDIKSLSEEFDGVYMFGVDKYLCREFRIERYAKCGPDTIQTGFDIQALSDQMAAHEIRHHVSNEPTLYLCNAAYYRMLCRNKNTVFVHIPSVKGMDEGFMAQLAALFRAVPISP